MKLFVFAALLILCGGAHAQFQPLPVETTQAQSASRQLSPHADQLAAILGIKSQVQRALALRSDRPAGTPMGLDELTLRQEISERAMAASFEADGVLAEISQEQARINEISTFLQGRRDKGVNVATLASLITGSGVGIAVNALQFSSSTANTGNGRRWLGSSFNHPVSDRNTSSARTSAPDWFSAKHARHPFWP